MKKRLRSLKFWLVAGLLGLLALRAGCPPGIRQPTVAPLRPVSHPVKFTPNTPYPPRRAQAR